VKPLPLAEPAGDRLRSGPPRTTGPGGEVSSFYHLQSAPEAGEFCQGLACFVARHLDPERWHASAAQQARVHCLGKCHIAPASAADVDRPRIEITARQPIVLRRLVKGGAPTLAACRPLDGYQGLALAIERTPDQIVDEVERSGLRGRGGAGFPAGRKWRAVSGERSPQKYVVANGDEGDPGAYIDRFLMEEDPHAIIEAMIIAGRAVGADRGLLYVRAEYPAAFRALAAAIAESRREGILGRRVLGTTFAFDVEVVGGGGSYVCGEETALLNALEGVRPEVRTRPPYPASHGLFGRPTLVHNIETLANIPWILEHGGDAYASIGLGDGRGQTVGSRGTKVVSLNSLFRRPGLYEVELGTPLRRIIQDLGGGLATGALRGVLVGGPLAGVLPPSLLDTPLAFEDLHAVGASVGHGGIIAIDERTTIPELVGHVAAFAAAESCGKCTPCRLGTRRMAEMVHRSLTSGGAEPGAREVWRTLIPTLADTSLCGHGSGFADFAASIERYFGPELGKCLG
jgi:NADH:ubiquinone oxidoreductase subunit F (NADH-binding)